MKIYACDKCDMEIKAPVCGKCDAELVDKTIEKSGQHVHVCECPKCHGMIKSPQCCGKDMSSGSDMKCC